MLNPLKQISRAALRRMMPLGRKFSLRLSSPDGWTLPNDGSDGTRTVHELHSRSVELMRSDGSISWLTFETGDKYWVGSGFLRIQDAYGNELQYTVSPGSL